jgi:hypothetical protein
MNEDGQSRMPQQPVIATPVTESFRYEAIKDIELEIEEMRALATEATIARYEAKTTIKRWTRHLTLVTKQPQSLERRLVDVESTIGGRVLQKPNGIISQRFWFHGGDWFYEATDAQGASSVRYHVSDDRIFKLVGGRAIAFSEAEAKHLLQIIPLYFNGICTDLYEKDVNTMTNNTLQLAV